VCVCVVCVCYEGVYTGTAHTHIHNPLHTHTYTHTHLSFVVFRLSKVGKIAFIGEFRGHGDPALARHALVDDASEDVGVVLLNKRECMYVYRDVVARANTHTRARVLERFPTHPLSHTYTITLSHIHPRSHTYTHTYSHTHTSYAAYTPLIKSSVGK
jgi:hypothetical protein